MERFVAAATRTRSRGDLAAKVLRDEALTIMGGMRSELVAALGHGPAVRHEIEVDVGEATELDRGVVVPVWWRATGRERLFPRFAGELLLQDDDAGACLRLQGRYAVPLGVVGRFGDGLAGRRVARRCMKDLMARIAANLDAAAGCAPSADEPYEVSVLEAIDVAR